MTSSVWTWLLALWLVATAAGIVTFWVGWFRSPHDEEWLPAGYVEHERVFVYPDSVLAVVAVTTAVLSVLERPVADSAALFAAGMATFLAVIDIAYFAQHGMFARERDGALHAFLVTSLLALAAVLVLTSV